MKTLLLSLLVLFGATTQTASASAQCHAILVGSHTHHLARKLQQILLDARGVDETLAYMQERGEITTIEEAARIRAQLTLGDLFAKQGAVHEAVYEVFKARYKSTRAIREALYGFNSISDWKEKDVLLSEIIERIMQYIPDVDTQNVAHLRKRAAYLNLTPDQLVAFRNKWLVFEHQDSFTDRVYGGVMALLIAPHESFVRDVLARGGLSYEWKRTLSGLDLPPLPRPAKSITHEDIVAHDLPYYDTSELVSYLRQSTSAARRFFVSDRSSFLTRRQLELLKEQASSLYLGEETQDELQKELVFRDEIVELARHRVSLKRRLTKIQTSLARLEKRHSFNAAHLQVQLNAVRAMEKPHLVFERSRELFNEYASQANSLEYVNVISKILNASTSRLKDAHPLAIELARHIVSTTNSFALEPSHSQKVRKLLIDFAMRIGSSAYRDLLQEVENLILDDSHLATMDEVELLQEKARSEGLLAEANDTWNEALSLGRSCEGARHLHLAQ